MSEPSQKFTERPDAQISGPLGRFESRVRVWAASAKVSGSIPKGGILSHMCACNAFTHSIARNLPSSGLEPGPISLQSGLLPISKYWQLGPPGLPRTIMGPNRG